MVLPVTSAWTDVKQCVQQFVINQECYYRPGDAGCIKDGTDRNRVMDGVVVTQA